MLFSGELYVKLHRIGLAGGAKNYTSDSSMSLNENLVIVRIDTDYNLAIVQKPNKAACFQNFLSETYLQTF